MIAKRNQYDLIWHILCAQTHSRVWCHCQRDRERESDPEPARFVGLRSKLFKAHSKIEANGLNRIATLTSHHRTDGDSCLHITQCIVFDFFAYYFDICPIRWYFIHFRLDDRDTGLNSLRMNFNCAHVSSNPYIFLVSQKSLFFAPDELTIKN